MRDSDWRTIQQTLTLAASSVWEPSSAPAERIAGDTLRLNGSNISLKVGINCLQVDPLYVGGVTTYVLGLLDGLATAGKACRFRLFVTGVNQHVFKKYLKCDNFDMVVISSEILSLRSNVCRASLISHSSSAFKFVSDVAFKDIQRLLDSESDVLYTPTPVLRYFNARRPSVLTMHDIQHLHYPEFFTRPRLLSRRITYELSARYARYFQANSNYTKEDLLKHFSWLAEDQVEVIPPGVSIEDFATPVENDSLRERYGLPDRFLFYPAQLWPHKNHLTILKALKAIEASCGLKIPLVLTGAKYSAAAKVLEFIADQSMDYVHHLGTVPFQDVVSLYQKASFMIMASLHESGGFPILESAAAGTPIIASRIPPFQEFGEVLQLNLFDPLDTKELARLIAELWKDQKATSIQVSHNLERVALYSWENTARKYIQLFRRAGN